MFELNLYGIEIIRCGIVIVCKKMFELNLYGIEIVVEILHRERLGCLN